MKPVCTPYLETSPQSDWRASNEERAALCAAVPVIAFLYALCWYPGPGGRVWYIDSVSFQYYAISRSIGHPPGYPQYLALTRAVASIPVGYAWQRVNLVSSVFGALSLCSHYVLSRLIGFDVLSAIGGALILGLSQTFFAQATEAEVYALNTFWLLSCISLFIQFLKTRDTRALWVFFIAYGLSLGHHPMMVLLVLPVTITATLHARSVFKQWQAYAAALVAILIGLAQYIYTYTLWVDPKLAFRFSQYEYTDYNFASFVDFTLGGRFRAVMFSQPMDHILREQIPKIVKIANAQNTLVLLGLGWCGLAFSRGTVAGARTLVSLCILAFLVWAFGYDVEDVDAFCTPLWALSYLAVVPGARALLPQHSTRLAFVLSVALAILAFRFTVLRPEYFKPDNHLLSVANEYIAATPKDAVLVPWKLGGSSALQVVFRYLQASGDSGAIRTVKYVKSCDPHVYFPEEARKLVRVRHSKAERVGRLERIGQDLFVMRCHQP